MFLTAALMNLMSVVSFLKDLLLCHRTFWLISLLCWGNVFCRTHRGKIEWGKNGSFLNPCRVFSPSVSLFWFLGVWWCFPHSGAAANLPCSIVLLASLWTCTAINMAKCSPSEASLQEDNTVTGIFSPLSPATQCSNRETRAWVRHLNTAQLLQPLTLETNLSRDACPIQGNTHKLRTHHHRHHLLPRPSNLRLLSPSRVQPNLNRELIFLSLLISKWSLLLISESCWFGFKDLASYLSSISQKNIVNVWSG